MAGLLTAALDKKSNPANAAGYTAATSEVDPSKGTVQGQLQSVLDKGGPLMTRAATRAGAASNAKGLLNSSMAVGAAQNAVLDAATPIAAADASTYDTNRKQTDANNNAAMQFTAGAMNTAGQQVVQGNQQLEAIGKQGEVQTGLQKLQGDQQQAAIAAQAAANQKLQEIQGDQRLTELEKQAASAKVLQELQGQQQLAGIAAQGEVSTGLKTLEGQQQQAAIEAQAAAARKLQEIQGDQRLTELQKQAESQKVLQELQGQQKQEEIGAQGQQQMWQLQQQAAAQRENINTQAARDYETQTLRGQQAQQIAQLQADSAAALQSLKGDQASQVVALENEYKNLLQTNVTAAGLYNSLLQSMTSVAGNSSIDDAGKKQMMTNMTDWLKSGLGLVGGISGYDLGSLLDFGA